MTAPAPNRQGNATRSRLVKTAERLFAAHGVDAVSVRAVNAAAGLGPASVNYHFGTKDDLIAAVLLDLGAAVRDSIRAHAGRLAARAEAPTTEELVRAVTEPYRDLLLRHRTRGMRWVKIVTQVSARDHPALRVVEENLREQLHVQVRRTFPDADPARLESRWAIALMGFLQALARASDWHAHPDPLPTDVLIAFYEDQVAFLAGGLDRLLRETT
ncbi:TetR/AcrR family transcriptional regulator [Nocardia africana]|uniref:Putative DNA-binding transcriptional regulator n=1 Tax=Nocardia africana TaxID=134964 RepID=A0A378X0C7_9NOCA|nr:TetR/AcrR family transcriptional regulator [Nocardia africana]MCC3312567.1 TetR/AcrR family transcriptional regulator [Nocardia africana]SUA46111.1 putative DNA-binding transcriptional regulator [Nocardia africana]